MKPKAVPKPPPLGAGLGQALGKIAPPADPRHGPLSASYEERPTRRATEKTPAGNGYPRWRAAREAGRRRRRLLQLSKGCGGSIHARRGQGHGQERLEAEAKAFYDFTRRQGGPHSDAEFIHYSATNGDTMLAPRTIPTVSRPEIRTGGKWTVARGRSGGTATP